MTSADSLRNVPQGAVQGEDTKVGKQALLRGISRWRGPLQGWWAAAEPLPLSPEVLVSTFRGLQAARGAICREAPRSSRGCSPRGAPGLAAKFLPGRPGVHGNRPRGDFCSSPPTNGSGRDRQPAASETPALIGQARLLSLQPQCGWRGSDASYL